MNLVLYHVRFGTTCPFNSELPKGGGGGSNKFFSIGKFCKMGPQLVKLIGNLQNFKNIKFVFLSILCLSILKSSQSTKSASQLVKWKFSGSTVEFFLPPPPQKIRFDTSLPFSMTEQGEPFRFLLPTILEIEIVRMKWTYFLIWRFLFWFVLFWFIQIWLSDFCAAIVSCWKNFLASSSREITNLHFK